MTPYIYSDDDNVPMNESAWNSIEDRDGHNPTVYLSFAEMRAAQRGEIPFSENKPDNGCWNCLEFDGDRCHKDWNNNDEDYYIPDRDDKNYDDICDDWRLDDSVKPEEVFDNYGNRP